MAQNYEDQSPIRRYLLHQLTGEEQQQIEQRLLTEDGVLEELEIAEDELIDEYLSERLSEDERHGFEENFLASPERQEKLRFSRSLRRYVVTAANQDTGFPGTPLTGVWGNQSWVPRVALTFGIVVVAAGAFWLFRTYTSPPPTVATLMLTISVENNRAGGVQAAKVNLESNVSELRLSLSLPEGAEGSVRYRVSLDNLDNERGDPRSLEPIRQDAKSVLLVIPADQLERGRYALKLFAIKSDGTEQRRTGAYYFDVE